LLPPLRARDAAQVRPRRSARSRHIIAHGRAGLKVHPGTDRYAAVRDAAAMPSGLAQARIVRLGRR